ncbi:MAG: DUF362 domain-containing protein [Melioribacteraceae bacterium]|nr:DUF362 domain-containing protein [Melioribacteraceae bacterium]
MDRRKFIKNSVAFGLGVNTGLGSYKKLFGMVKDDKPVYDLVAVKGGEPDVMFDKGIASLGGMKNFVNKNKTVVIKPNIGWDTSPERAANTNPILVKRIIEHCYEAGAKTVYVFDHTCDEWGRCYRNSGIEHYVNAAGGTMVPGNSESYYQKVAVPNGKVIQEAKAHELILESDVFINVPVLKSHGGATLTMSMKNLMGVVWDRRYWHRNGLHQCIADFATFRKPDLNVLDAYAVMKRNGPRGVSVQDVISMKSLLISTDIVAADAAGAKLFGLEPDEIDHIKYAHELKAGSMDLSGLSIKRIKI